MPKNIKDRKASAPPSLSACLMQPLKAVFFLVSLCIHNIYLFLCKLTFWFAYYDFLKKYLEEFCPPVYLLLRETSLCILWLCCDGPERWAISHRFLLASSARLSPVGITWPKWGRVLPQFCTCFSCLPSQVGISLILDGVTYLILVCFGCCFLKMMVHLARSCSLAFCSW